MFISIEQIRAARALLRWTQKDLAARAGLNDDQVHNFEGGRSRSLEVLESIHRAFIANGIEFTEDGGVHPRHSKVFVYKGREGFRTFYDDVYEVAKSHANPDICVTNTNEAIYDHWLGDYGPVHFKRMEELKNVKVRVLLKEKDPNPDPATYCVYRWLPEKLYADVPLYIYGNKAAFLEFMEHNVLVTVVENSAVANSLRKMFELTWASAITDPRET